jgi:hypothetical protein
MGKETELDGLLGGFRNLFKSREHLDCLSWNDRPAAVSHGLGIH